MLHIELINDSVKGEPGPNMVWRGRPEDFKLLLCDLHSLGRHRGVKIDMLSMEYVTSDLESLVCFSVDRSMALLGGQGRQFYIKLSCQDWQDILAKILSVSYSPSFNYLEFDEMKLEEVANLIIISEV